MNRIKPSYRLPMSNVVVALITVTRAVAEVLNENCSRGTQKNKLIPSDAGKANGGVQRPIKIDLTLAIKGPLFLFQ